jgi:two-component system cell cycle sensor histidine kinase/response regulator CckA
MTTKSLDLNALVSEFNTTLRRTLGNNVHLATIFGSTLYQVRMDAAILQQMLLSFAMHAGQHLSPGGRITIETKNVTLDGSADAAVSPGAYVKLALSGTGANVAALKNALRSAPDVSSLPNSLPLDFSQIPGILQPYRGWLQFHGDTDRSTGFTIYLPRCEDRDLTLPLPDADHTDPLGTETILLVEDEDSVRALIRTLLQSCGYTVLAAIHADEALLTAQNHPHPIDLLITDLVLPRMNGKVLIDQLLMLRPRMKVLVISGYPQDRIAQVGGTERDFAFLQKPFRCEVLANFIRQLLDAPARRSISA